MVTVTETHFAGRYIKMILSLPESKICGFNREADKIQGCLNLLKQCKSHGQAEPAHVQQKWTITNMLENCDYLDKRKMSVRKPKRMKRVKRSEPPSEGPQRDKDRDFLKPRSMMALGHNLY